MMHQSSHVHNKFGHHASWLFEFVECRGLNKHRQTLEDLRQHRQRTLIGHGLRKHCVHNANTIRQYHRERHEGRRSASHAIGLL